MGAPGLPYPCNYRLQAHPGDLGFDPLRLRISILTAAADSDDRAVPTRLKVSQVPVLLQMNFRQPLHVGNTVPTRHDQADREALLAPQWLSIQLVGYQWFRSGRILEGDAPAELLVEL